MAFATTVSSRIETTEQICVASRHSGTERGTEFGETDLELTPLPPVTASGGNSVTSDAIADMSTTSSTTYDYLFKLLLCGDCGVGKTSMLRQYVSDEMNDAYIATVGKL